MCIDAIMYRIGYKNVKSDVLKKSVKTKKVKVTFQKRHFVAFFIADPVDYIINAHSVFANFELSYDTRNKW